jgi:hypothetical protein
MASYFNGVLALSSQMERNSYNDARYSSFGFQWAKRDHREMGEGSGGYHDWPGSQYDTTGHGGITLSVVRSIQIWISVSLDKTTDL